MPTGAQWGGLEDSAFLPSTTQVVISLMNCDNTRTALPSLGAGLASGQTGMPS